MSPSRPPRRLPCGCAILVAGLAACLAGDLAAAEPEGWDHLVLVDLAPKDYRLRIDEPGHTRFDAHGTFDSSVMVSPTLRIRGDSPDGNVAVMGVLGLSYAHYRDRDLAMDSVEWQMGLGGCWRLNAWSDFSLHGQVGTGTLHVTLPDAVHAGSGRDDSWDPLMHGEVMAILAFHPYEHCTVTLNAGARVLYQSVLDEEGNHTTYSNVITGGMFGAGLGVTF